jgi:hypothetical protein
MNHSLRELKNSLSEAYEVLSWEVREHNTNTSVSLIYNANVVRTSVETIEELGLFEALINEIKSSPLFKLSGDTIRMSNAEAIEVNRLLNQLNDLADSLLTFLAQVVINEDPLSINIKLPNVKDFNDLAEHSRNLHLAFTQVIYLDDVNGDLKIESVENGSIWLNVMLYGAITGTVVASLIWSAAVVYKKILETKVLEQQLRGITIRNDSLEDVLQGQKASIANLIQSEAEHVNSTSFKTNEPENIERIKGSIRLFAELLDKGAEVHPAIGAPEQVSNLFPNMKALPTIESKTKQLSA